MADQTREALERLLGAADGLIADMRERAIMRGDYEIEDGKKIATLDCGNSVLFGIDGARVAAREALARAQQAGPVAFRQFLSDVSTAAGLLSHGKQDKGLASRISEAAYAYMRSTPPVVPEEWRSLVKHMAFAIEILCDPEMSDDELAAEREAHTDTAARARALLAAPAPARTSVGWSACHEGHYTPSGRAAPEQREKVELTAGALQIGGNYNWKGQPERLVYLGREGGWHQFAKVDEPRQIWSEVLGEDMHMLEESPEAGGEVSVKGGVA